MPRNRSLPPHLEIRRAGYYWRRRLPRSLRDRGGAPQDDPEEPNCTPSKKSFLCFSLRTHVPANAKMLARRLTEMSDLVFAADAETTMAIAPETQVQLLESLARFEIEAFECARAVAPPRSAEAAAIDLRREEALQITLRQALHLNELIEKAKDENGVTRKLKAVTIGEGGDVAPTKPISVPAPSIVDQMLAQAEAKTKPTVVVADGEDGDTWVQPATEAGGMADAATPFTFSTPEEVKVARIVLDQVLPQIGKQIRSIKDLNDPKMVEKIADTAMTVTARDEGLFASLTKEQAVAVAAELCKSFVERTLAIPALTITPEQQVSFGFRRFDLDMKSWNFQPLSRELFVQVLRTEKTSVISGEEEGETVKRLEDYIVARLIDYPEIDYDAHAEILYELAGQAVAHTRRRFSEDEDQALSVVRGHPKSMAESIFSQMKQHMWREQTNYRVSLASAYGELRPQTFDTAGTGFIRDFRTPPDQKQDIRKYVFTGFARGCYQYAKFDSDPERKLAVVLEKEPCVRLWMKPGPNQFKIFDANGAPYQPDFVIETDTEKLIIEVKRSSEMNAPEVLRKADAACLWCHVATKASAADGEKPWSYLLVPETDVQENFTVSGLMAKHTRSPDADLLSRYDFSEELVASGI